jgi:L-alanine-DL-glutamate epimerase-like enolase superfamily enzyme
MSPFRPRKSLKIQEIERIPIVLNVVKPGWQGRYYFWPSQIGKVIVKIHTSNGLVGLGETHAEPHYYGNTLVQDLKLLELYERAIKGEDPTNTVNIHRIMDKIAGRGCPNPQSARSGIDMALYDLKGKALDVPVYSLLGGAFRNEFELKTDLYYSTPEEMVKESLDYVKKGYRGLKIKIGLEVESSGFSPELLELETRKLKAVLEAVPKSVLIDADANQAWESAGRTIQMFHGEFEEYKNLALEQPIPYWDLDGLSTIARELSIPLILDETITDTHILIQAIRKQACDRICIKLARVGGLYVASKLIHIAESAGLNICIDGLYSRLGEAALCHLAAIVRDPFPLAAESRFWFKEDPMKGGAIIENGIATIPERPGLGVELDEDLIHECMAPKQTVTPFP